MRLCDDLMMYPIADSSVQYSSIFNRILNNLTNKVYVVKYQWNEENHGKDESGNW
jgi:hypothetical protein